MRESALNVNILHGVFVTSGASTGTKLVSDDIAKWGIKTGDVQSSWVIVPRLGEVVRCDSVNETFSNTLELTYGLDVASGEEFWLSRENPTVIATACKQQLALQSGSLGTFEDVVLRPGDAASMRAAVGGTGAWSWQSGVLEVRFERSVFVDYVYAGERGSTLNESIGGIVGLMDRGSWEYDFQTHTLRLHVYPDTAVYTVRLRQALLSPNAILRMNPLSASAGQQQIGEYTTGGEPYMQGVSASRFMRLVNDCSAQILDELQMYQSYEEKLGYQRQATSRRNRADENDELAVGNLT